MNEESKRSLEEELKRASASLGETKKVLHGGLELAKTPEGMDLEEIMKGVLFRLKGKKAPLELEASAPLEGKWMRVGRQGV